MDKRIKAIYQEEAAWGPAGCTKKDFPLPEIPAT